VCIVAPLLQLCNQALHTLAHRSSPPSFFLPTSLPQRLLMLQQQKIQRFSLVIEGMVDTPITEHLMMNRYNFLVHGLLQVCNPPHPNLLKMLQSNDK